LAQTVKRKSGENSRNRESVARTMAESHVQLSQFMSPGHANAQGNVHGGEIMKLADEAGALAAMRHSRSHVVTVAMDSMTFMEPIYVGNLVILEAEVTYVGQTSMEVRVEVTAENPLTGVRTTTNTAYLVYVAIDQQGRPQRVAPLVATDEEERLRMEEAQARQTYRKQQREREARARQRQRRVSGAAEGTR
jgi:uncharacterized protein (TIGR00369 family)